MGRRRRGHGDIKRPRNSGFISNPFANRAAEYVRTSTELQEYSLQHQQDVIRAYAAIQGMEIVRTYADEDRSGVTLKGRGALKQLIGDVVEGRNDFGAILIYDVSRWGRFQNPDEGAYYEYVCKRSGVRVHYCAEMFINDESPMSAIAKCIKRAMAAERSRELSVKCFAGASRLVSLGYNQGGTTPYGFRRLAVDESGLPKGILTRGQYKSLRTDRVILVPGPPREIETVRSIYRMYCQGKGPLQIARTLNVHGVKSHTGRPWSKNSIDNILRNEKYIGNNVWNQYSRKLHVKVKHNAPSEWIRCDGALAPIIDRQLFDAVQNLRKDHVARRDPVEMLKRLRRLLDECGTLTHSMLANARAIAHPGTYWRRFGGMRNAYLLVGFNPPGRSWAKRIQRQTGPGAAYCAMG